MKFVPGPEALFVIGLMFVAPAAIARAFVGAGWLTIACAFVVWFFALWLMLGGTANRFEEGLGWTLIMGMFFSWAGVPFAALILRNANIPYRFL